MKKVSDMEACIPLSADFMAEVRWWHDLLPEWNEISLIYDQHWTANADFKLWTDAINGIQSAVCNHRCSCYMGLNMGRQEDLDLL